LSNTAHSRPSATAGGQEVNHIAFLKADLTVFHLADRRVRTADGLGGLLGTDAARFT
jgi:hypothetical protein